MAKEKKRGLLDQARSAVSSLLGDFPEGFTRGALAGFAGWPGDLAYLGDTARRAAMLERSGPAAQDFPGTTDYIAAKAGYPIPQSFSGQLGSMLGGMLSPSPTDLAKIAPVLAAIPFWHGSPYKYDAPDFSKIGTGEGAQAYGWGMYGAQVPETAIGYTPPALRVNVDYSKFSHELDNGNSAAYAAILDSGGDIGEARKKLQKHIALFERDAKNKPDDAAALLQKAEWRRQGIKLIDDGVYSTDREGSNLYRGEYRWPDPNVEAKTPLTEADMLDWDKPLSEQSPQVQSAIRKQMPDDAWEKMKGRTGQDYYEHYWNGGISGSGQPTQASDALLDLGIPGIRYLDANSRGAGEGTHNYVMFDERGIKLLERNGEPINPPGMLDAFVERRAGKTKPYQEALLMDQASRLERARGMGFDTGKTWYHGANRIDRLLEKPGLDPKRATSGPMPFFTDDPSVASNYASGKVDTSRLNEDVDYASWFKVKAGRGKAKNFTDSWYYLTDEERSAIKQNIGRIQRNEETGELEFGEGPGGQAHWDFALKQAHGNPLKAAKDVLLDSGVLYGDEEKFIEALKMAGLKHPVEYNSPQMTAPGILQAYARTSNPLDTSDKDALGAVLSQLEQASKGKRYKSRQGGVDPWDKNNIGIREFTERLKDDLNNGTTHAFTSIPDVVTEELRKMGYDAILDKGGKFTGQTHDVLIPFAPEQIRSVNAKFDPSKILNPDLLASMAALGIGTEAWREYQRQQNRKQGAQ